MTDEKERLIPRSTVRENMAQQPSEEDDGAPEEYLDYLEAERRLRNE